MLRCLDLQQLAAQTHPRPLPPGLPSQHEPGQHEPSQHEPSQHEPSQHVPVPA